MDATFLGLHRPRHFLGIVFYMKVPGTIGKSLDARADKIQASWKRPALREEAQQLLPNTSASARKPRRTRPTSSSTPSARLQLAGGRGQAEDRGLCGAPRIVAEQKISQAERDAVNEVRAKAVDIAVEASAQVLAARSTPRSAASCSRSSRGCA